MYNFLKNIMINRFLKLIFLISILTAVLFSFSAEQENFKLVNSQNSNKLNFYLFIEVDNCSKCAGVIDEINDFNDFDGVNCVSFIRGLTDENAKSFANQNNLKTQVIADPIGAYNKYYEAESLPYIAIYDKKGNLLLKGKFPNEVSIDEIHDIYQNSKTIKQSILKELSRFKVKIDNEPIIGNDYYRDILPNSDFSKFYLRNTLKKSLIEIDAKSGNANIKNKSINAPGFRGTQGLFWDVTDSIVVFYNDNSDFNRVATFYDIQNESIINSIVFYKPKSDYPIAFDITNFYNMQKKQTLICERIKKSLEEIKLSDDNEFTFIYENNSNFLKSFGKYDSLFLKYNLNEWSNQILDFDSEGNIYLFQQFTDYIAKYNSNADFIEYFKINFDENYLIPDFSLTSNEATSSKISKINKLSRTWYLLKNKTKMSFLICFFNEKYSDKAKSLTSSDVVMTKFITIANFENGESNSITIEVDKSFIPFYFSNDEIFCSELNNGAIEIVKYSIQTQ